MLLEGLNKPVGEGYPTKTAMSTLGRNAWFSAGQKLGTIKQGLEKKVWKTKYHQVIKEIHTLGNADSSVPLILKSCNRTGKSSEKSSKKR